MIFGNSTYSIVLNSKEVKITAISNHTCQRNFQRRKQRNDFSTSKLSTREFTGTPSTSCAAVSFLDIAVPDGS